MATGLGAQSFILLGLAAWYWLVSRFWAKKARAARRHRELRAKRLEGEREGLAPPRG